LSSSLLRLNISIKCVQHSCKHLLPPTQHLATSTACNYFLGQQRVGFAENLDIGRQTVRVAVVNALTEPKFGLSASEVDDIATGLTRPNSVLPRFAGTHHALNCEGEPHLERSQNLLGRIGHNVKDGVGGRDIVQTFVDKLQTDHLPSMSPEEIQHLRKLAHLRFLLTHFCRESNTRLRVKVEKPFRKASRHDVEITLEKDGDEPQVFSQTMESSSAAIDLACYEAIQTVFQEEFAAVNLDDFTDIPMEQEVDLGHRNLVRNLVLKKRVDEPFGFSIRGGQQKLVKNKKFMQTTETTPIIVSKIHPGGPADEAGLKVGDILLGINDHNLKDKVHTQAVQSLKKAVEAEETAFTVRHSQHYMHKLDAEEKLLQRDFDAVKKEMNTPGWREWHAARSRVEPMDYFMEQFEEKPKYRYLAPRGRKANRLWHEYKSTNKSTRDR